MGVRTDLARCRDGEELSRAELVRVDLDCADLGHPSDTCQVGVGGVSRWQDGAQTHHICKAREHTRWWQWPCPGSFCEPALRLKMLPV